jgi:hypothetical protein
MVGELDRADCEQQRDEEETLLYGQVYDFEDEDEEISLRGLTPEGESATTVLRALQRGAKTTFRPVRHYLCKSLSFFSRARVFCRHQARQGATGPVPAQGAEQRGGRGRV